MRHIKSCFFALMVLLAAGKPASAWASDVQVISLEGKVEISNAGQKEFYAAQEGQILYPFDKIRTQKKSSAEIGFDDKKENVVRIEEDTDAVLLIQEEEKIKLLRGRVFTMLQNLPPGAAFEIRTPTAVSGARGTEWLTEVDSEGATTVESYFGKPYIQNIDQAGKRAAERLFVTPGNMSQVRNFMPPTALTRMPEVKIKQWNQLRPLIRKRAIKGINIPKVYQNTPVPLKKKMLPQAEYKTNQADNFITDHQVSSFIPDNKVVDPPKSVTTPQKSVTTPKKSVTTPQKTSPQAVKTKYNLNKRVNALAQ